MRTLTQAIYTALISDAALAVLLNQYAGYPAVFTVDPAPKDAKPPYIVSVGEVSNRSGECKDGKYRIVTRDIRCYDNNTGSSELVEKIADRVIALFDRQPSALSLSDGVVSILDVSGGIALDDEFAFGRIVSLEIHIILN